MDTNGQDRPIFIRRKRKTKGRKHSGAWKIAYADFVTAMMAFFLLMWLMSTTTKVEQEGISEFFKNPISFNSKSNGSNPNLVDFKGSAKSIAEKRNSLANNARTDHLTPKDKYILNQQMRLEQEDNRRIEKLKHDIEKAIVSNHELSQFRDQILVEVTKEGLLLQIIDKENRPMFETGEDIMKPYTVKILSKLAETINSVPNKIRVTGHTDAQPYTGANQKWGNWDLSARRAMTATHVLVDSRMEPDRLERVAGASDTRPLVEDNPFDASNRRITILVLKITLD